MLALHLEMWNDADPATGYVCYRFDIAHETLRKLLSLLDAASSTDASVGAEWLLGSEPETP